MFNTKDQQGRDVGVMAKTLQLEGNVLQYHLDRLQEANLAEMTSFNYLHGHVYWDCRKPIDGILHASKLRHAGCPLPSEH
jgi:hypothetical protein